MTEKTLPTPEYLRKRLRYDPETGKLFWIDCEEMSKSWRTRRAGKEALTAVSACGYRFGQINYMVLYAHRIAWAIYSLQWPDGQIDHINGVRSDNRIENLRVVSNQKNGHNRAMTSLNNSGVSGVHWDKNRGLWKAEIVVNKKSIHLGRFADLKEAASARAEANIKYGFSERHGTKAAS